MPSENTPSKQQWGSKIEFMLSAIGLAVGLGNIWRFPFKCFENGGAVFLIPYIVMLVLVGIPVYFLELSLGQFSGRGPIEAWNQSIPILKGLGYATVINVAITGMYYMILVAWTIFYIAATFTSILPWSRCELGLDEWSDEDCYSVADTEYCMSESREYNFYANGTCVNMTGAEIQSFKNSSKLISPSEQYFNNFMLQRSPDMNQLGPINWHLALCLLLAWLIVYICCIKGTRSIGKVAYVTALFPYVALTILLIRGATLEGAKQGIYFYLVPKFNRLLDPKVWYDAAAQILYSLGCATGCIITFASYNPFHGNCRRDAIIVSTINCITSAYAGFAIFSILGYMAHDLGVDVDAVAKGGEGLAFIAYPQAVSRMPVSQLWSFMFFFMIILLGIGTMFGPITAVVSVIEDQWPFLSKRKWIVLAAVCSVMYICALPLICESGIYLFSVLVDYTGLAIVFCALMEVIGISYIYGYNRFSSDIKLMLHTSPNVYWKVTWVITAPMLLLGIMVYNWILYAPLKYDKVPLPNWLNGIGWAVFVAILSPIPAFAIHKLLTCKGNYKSLITPTDIWGPSESVPEIRKEYIQSDDRKYFNRTSAHVQQIELVRVGNTTL
ncbi:SLC6A7 (predicted) [Pycnogonum litorale]